MINNNRDFIDFLIELYEKKRIFLIFLVLAVGYAAYFNEMKNNDFSFKTTINIAPESILIPIINNLNIYQNSAIGLLQSDLKNVSYKSLELDLCQLIRSTFVDKNFTLGLADDYLRNTPSSLESIDVVFNNLQGSLKMLPNDITICINAKITSDKKYISYLNSNYESMMNSFVQTEMTKRLSLIRLGKLDYLEQTLDSTKTTNVDKNRQVTLGQLELNNLEERKLTVLSNLQLLQNTTIADTNIPFLIWNSSKTSQNLNQMFLYAFAIFISIIFYVLTVIMIDFKGQYKSRASHKN